jgi:hypothetical protein
MKLAALALAGLLTTAASDEPLLEGTGDNSFAIVEHAGIFCDNGRALIKPVKNRLTIWCEHQPAAAITITADDGQGGIISGITIYGDALEYIATH